MSENGNIPHPEPGLKPLRLKGSGKTVYIRKTPFSAFLALKISQAYPPPKPPMQEVQYDTGPVMEPNESDPQYLKAIEEHDQMVKLKMMQLALKRGVHVDMNDEMRAEVAGLRADLKDMLEIELDESDEFVWLVHIAAADQDDLSALMEAVARRSEPTEAAITEVAETFPGAI